MTRRFVRLDAVGRSGGAWRPALYCSVCVEHLRQTQFKQYTQQLANTTCKVQSLPRSAPVLLRRVAFVWFCCFVALLLFVLAICPRGLTSTGPWVRTGGAAAAAGSRPSRLRIRTPDAATHALSRGGRRC